MPPKTAPCSSKISTCLMRLWLSRLSKVCLLLWAAHDDVLSLLCSRQLHLFRAIHCFWSTARISQNLKNRDFLCSQPLLVMSDQVHISNSQFLWKVEERWSFNSRHCTRHSSGFKAVTHIPNTLFKAPKSLWQYKGSSSTGKKVLNFKCYLVAFPPEKPVSNTEMFPQRVKSPTNYFSFW